MGTVGSFISQWHRGKKKHTSGCEVALLQGHRLHHMTCQSNFALTPLLKKASEYVKVGIVFSFGDSRSDLYGAIGFPRRLTRTVIVGKNKHLVQRLLNVLSYFIRCGELLENSEAFPSLNSPLPSPSESVMTVYQNSVFHPTDTNTNNGSSRLSLSSENQLLMSNQTGRVHFCKSGLEQKNSVADNSSTNTLCDQSEVNGESTTSISSFVPQMLFRSNVEKQVWDQINSAAQSCNGDNCCKSYTYEQNIVTARPVTFMVPDRTSEMSLNGSPAAHVLSAVEDSLPCKMSPNGPCDNVPLVIERTRGRAVELPALQVENNHLQRVKLDQRMPASEEAAKTPKLLRVSIDARPSSLEIPAKQNTSCGTAAGVVSSGAPNGLVSVCGPVAETKLTSICPRDKHASGTTTLTGPHLVTRGNSMFDEYFEVGDTSLPALDRCHYDANTLDDVIMNEPCPDVSHIVTTSSVLSEQLAITLSSLELLSTGCAPLQPAASSSDLVYESDYSSIDSEALSIVDTHFALGGDQLTDVPEGPSKQQLCSAVELIQDVFADRVSIISEGRSDRDDYMCQWASEPAVHPKRLAHRNPSGQSNSGSNSFRSPTPSEPSWYRSSSVGSDTTFSESCDQYIELKMPACAEGLEEGTVTSHTSNIGRSLLADYCDSYQSDFVLQGTNDRDFLKRDLHRDLQLSLKNSVLDEDIGEASCIVADIDNCTVQLYSCKYNLPKEMKTQKLAASQLVAGILESCQDFRKLDVSPEFCLMHLEDQLQSIYVKSHMLVEYINAHQLIFHQELKNLHGFELSDMPLLLAVASTHSPHLLLSLMDMSPCRH